MRTGASANRFRNFAGALNEAPGHGLNIRFFSVAIATGQDGRSGNLTGKTFSEQKRATDLGMAVTNGPLATK